MPMAGNAAETFCGSPGCRNGVPEWTPLRERERSTLRIREGGVSARAAFPRSGATLAVQLYDEGPQMKKISDTQAAGAERGVLGPMGHWRKELAQK